MGLLPHSHTPRRRRAELYSCRPPREEPAWLAPAPPRRAPGYRCAVVTNDYHAFRAALMARRAGVNGHVVGARTARYYWPSATIREFVAVLAEHRALHLVLVAGLVTVGVLLGTGR